VFSVKKMVEIIAKIHLYRSVVGLLHWSLQSEGQEDRVFVIGNSRLRVSSSN
jgi:hypothetical protein